MLLKTSTFHILLSLSAYVEYGVRGDSYVWKPKKEKKNSIKKVIYSSFSQLCLIPLFISLSFLSHIHLCIAGLYISKAEIQTPTLPLSALLAQLPHSPLGLSCQKSPSLPWISTKPSSYLLVPSKICPLGELYTLHVGENSAHTHNDMQMHGHTWNKQTAIHSLYIHTHTPTGINRLTQNSHTHTHIYSFSHTHRMKSACSFSGGE